MSRNQGIHSCGKTRFSFRTAIFLAVVGWVGHGSSLCRGHNCSCIHGPKGASGALDGMGAVIASLDGEISQFGCGAGGGGSGDSVLARASVLVAEGEVVTGTMLGELSRLRRQCLRTIPTRKREGLRPKLCVGGA